ncbi:hypothetical protein ACFL35_02310 [Candidatus Riflebacteria bacterium]
MKKACFGLIILLFITSFPFPGSGREHRGKIENFSKFPRGSYSLWFREFDAAIKEYLKDRKPHNREKIESVIRIKPIDDYSSYLTFLNSFDSYCKDYLRTRKRILKSVIENYLLVRMKYIREQYQVWFFKFRSYLKDYSRFQKPEKKYVIDVFSLIAPKGRESDYKSWFKEYKFYMTKYKRYKNEEYFECVQWLEKVKPLSAAADLNFLDQTDATIISITKNENHMQQFNNLVIQYYYTLKYLAGRGDLKAKEKVLELENIIH